MDESESLKKPNVIGDATVNQLMAEYHRWMLGQGLDLGSPDKHLMKPSLRRNAFGSQISACAGNSKSGNARGLPSNGIWAPRPTRAIER
jgi:hypothetical protein